MVEERHYPRSIQYFSAYSSTTSLPYERTPRPPKSQDRGILRAGLAADLVAFDPATVRSEATFETPNRYSTGFRYVAVNGVLVVDDGKLTGKTPGQPLRGPGYRQRVGVMPTPKK